jgi:hypothetical protein
MPRGGVLSELRLTITVTKEIRKPVIINIPVFQVITLRWMFGGTILLDDSESVIRPGLSAAVTEAASSNEISMACLSIAMRRQWYKYLSRSSSGPCGVVFTSLGIDSGVVVCSTLKPSSFVRLDP